MGSRVRFFNYIDVDLTDRPEPLIVLLHHAPREWMVANGVRGSGFEFEASFVARVDRVAVW